jgi:glycerol-3-phosphate O-acyltransferase
MVHDSFSGALLSQAELSRMFLGTAEKLQQTYQPGKDRVITPNNVYHPCVVVGRPVLEAFQLQLFLPGSGVVGLEHLDHALAQVRAGRSVLFMPEHRGTLDVPSFNSLLRLEPPRYHEILDRLVYVAGRKLNESSDFIKMFAEKYSRLVIVPRRELPKPKPDETPAEAELRAGIENEAGRINRAAFRALVRLKKEGKIVVLFPMGGRLKPDADNIPVRETISYVRAFDTAYLVSMEGNTMPPLARLEDERPVKSKVVFRIGPALDCKAFLAGQKTLFEQALASGAIPRDADLDQFAVENVVAMLANLRLNGAYGDPAASARPLEARA